MALSDIGLLLNSLDLLCESAPVLSGSGLDD